MGASPGAWTGFCLRRVPGTTSGRPSRLHDNTFSLLNDSSLGQGWIRSQKLP